MTILRLLSATVAITATAVMLAAPGAAALAGTHPPPPPAAAAGSGTIQLGSSAFNLSWTLSDPTVAGAGDIQFTLAWDGDSSDDQWAAFGLHPSPGQGMPDAEIFMCQPTAKAGSKEFCQVRNSSAGYTTPAISTDQYITLISYERTGTRHEAVFSRPVKAASGYDIRFNATMGLIYAQGKWSGDPMPAGSPIKHTDVAARSQVNFYAPSPSPTPPGPSPSPHKPGVWPDRFTSNMTIAKSQLAVDGHLAVSFYARISYDFPARSQLWEYFDLETRESVGGELWVGEMLYSFNGDKSTCYTSNMTFDILRPDWLHGTTYVTTNYLLRQPEIGPACGPGNYTLADLYQIPNTLGMTNSWVVSNSPLAEPIRLMGPDDFDEPKWRSILEYAHFKPLTSFPAGHFDVPSSCSKTDAAEADVAQLGSAFRFGKPSQFWANLAGLQ